MMWKSVYTSSSVSKKHTDDDSIYNFQKNARKLDGEIKIFAQRMDFKRLLKSFLILVITGKLKSLKFPEDILRALILFTVLLK